MDLRDKWNSRYKESDGLPKAARVLHENLHLLPARGNALDVACGLGANAIELARQGQQVDAVDISDIAIASLQARASQQGLSINALVLDIEQAPPEPAKYDVIVVSYFLSRPLIPALIAALKPGGLLYYQTFTQSKVSDRGPKNPDYRLADQELLTLIPDCHILVYREEGRIGDTALGFRDEVMYVGMKKS
jgi:2-polyprenyl-3-methyl-5-hydroxy-6-metoxy-1,4-benzoquinol methylase